MLVGKEVAGLPEPHWRPSMPIENDVEYVCPSCGETNAVGVDPTAGSRQRFVEDCPVCCRPLVFVVVVDRDGDAVIERVERE